jgi:polysaccharide pyruvyl transferase WcaK-like protein
LLSRDGIETTLLPAELSAAELKWCIGRLSLLVGARTHATIAALSQAIPTVSLAYSVKAYGINVDLLGSDEFIVDAADFEPDTVADAVRRALADDQAIRSRLAGTSEQFKARAFRAGELLVERVLTV